MQEVEEALPLGARPKTVALVDDSSWRLAASCTGFLADAYDLFTIDLVILILQLEYGEDVIGSTEKSLIVSTMIAGVVVGQLTFGFVADAVGRKWTFVTTALLTVIGALASALTFHTAGPYGLPFQLAVCRALLGVGVGGEYPLSATVTAESSQDPASRCRMLAIVISMQGFGMLLSSIVAVVALYAQMSLENTWRVLLCFGALPSVVAVYLRWHLAESEVFEQAKKTAETAETSSAATIRAFSSVLVGTAGCWMLMNIFQYSMGSFKSTIINDVMPTRGLDNASQVMVDAQFAMICSGFAIGGFALGHILISWISRMRMQFYGFLGVAVTFLSLSTFGDDPKGWVLLVCLGLMFFFVNAGPNITTFVIPAEAFPTRVRATCHGISAASGKIGALLGTASLPPAAEAFGMPTVYFTCAIVATVAAMCTYVYTPRHVLELAKLDGPSADAVAAMYAVDGEGDSKKELGLGPWYSSTS